MTDRGSVTAVPDGVGLSDEAVALVAKHDATVHLRLTAPGRHPVTACGAGLGQWWSGLPAETTCADCRAVAAHAPWSTT